MFFRTSSIRGTSLSKARLRLAVLEVLAVLAVLAPQAGHADIDADVLKSIKSDPTSTTTTDTEVAASQTDVIDPDSAGSPHFKPSAEMMSQALSIAKGLHLGMLGLSSGTLSTMEFPPAVSAMSDVLYYNNQQTSAAANYGIKAYAAASARSEDRLFSAAYRLYSHLKSLGPRASSAKGLTPIQEHSPIDIYTSYALPAARGNPYLALKALLLFGQDNMQNGLLTDDARSLALNRLNPGTDSILYLNGALGPLYSDADVAAGQAIATACSDVDFSYDERAHCNDGHSDYQGDYYHVITSAFLGCRQDILSRGDSSLLGKVASTSGMLDKGYFASVRRYKIDRFIESVKVSSDDKGDLLVEKTVLSAALARAGSLLDPVRLEITSDEKKSLSPHARKVVNATLARYNFEIEFRVRQHAMGLAFGRKACKDLTTLDGTPVPGAPTELSDSALVSDPRDAKATPDGSGGAPSAPTAHPTGLHVGRAG